MPEKTKTKKSQSAEEQITFSAAMTELDSILRKLQSTECDIDSLTTLTRRAISLIAICRNRLTTTDEELREILESLKA